MGHHKDLSTGDQHIIQQWSYASQAVRTAASGFAATDVGKCAYVASDQTIWALVDDSPVTWDELTGTTIPGPHASTHEDGGADEVTLENLPTGSTTSNHVALADGAGGLAMGFVAHSDTTGQTTDDHHAQTHASSHSDGGADEVTVENLATASVDPSARLISDGTGGVAMELNTFLDSVKNTTNTPPGGPSTGERYIVGTVPTGAWVGHANEIAHWNGTAWAYTGVVIGLIVYEENGSRWRYYDGFGWTGAGTLVPHSETTGQTTDDHHAQTHAASHSDGGADEITVENLATAETQADQRLVADGTGGLAWATPSHDELSNVTGDQHHAEQHTIASHTDTTATGTELETLTDGSNADSLHIHAAAEATDVRIPCRKGSVGTITKGSPVYVSGYNVGGWYEVEAAKADSASTMPAVGVADEDLTNSATGQLNAVGTVDDIDTSSWAVTDELWVSAATAGDLTNVKPTGATNFIQKIAVVLRSNAVNGAIAVFGAGRSNDVPNIAEGNVWVGNTSGVATEKKYYLIEPADDLAAIVNAATGGEVFFLTEGTHVASAAIDLSGNDNVSLIGTRQSIIQTTYDNAVALGDGNYQTIEGFHIEHTPAAGGYTTIQIQGGNDTKNIIRNITGQVITNDSVFIQKTGTGTESDFTIEGCYAWGQLLRGIDISPNTGGVDFIIRNNRFESDYGSAEEGIRLDTDTGEQDKRLFVHNNRIRLFGCGIYVENCTHSQVFDNFLIENNRTTLDPLGHSIYILNSDGCVVRGNTILTARDSGIAVNLSDECVVENNYMDNTDDDGIQLLSVTNSTVKGNYIHDSVGYCIDEDASCSGIEYESNTLDTATVALWRYQGSGQTWDHQKQDATVTPAGTTQTLDWNDGSSHVVDLGSATGDVTLTLSNPLQGQTYLIKFIQGLTVRDVVLPSTVLIPGGSAPTTLNVTEVDDAEDALVLYFDGTNYLANFTQNYG